MQTQACAHTITDPPSPIYIDVNTFHMDSEIHTQTPGGEGVRMGVLAECQCLECRKPARVPPDMGVGHGVHPEVVITLRGERLHLQMCELKGPHPSSHDWVSAQM